MRTAIDIEIIRRVKLKRSEQKVSQSVLSEVLGTTAGFVGQVESVNYIAKYSASQLYLIAKFFECDLSELYPPINHLEP